MFIAHSYCSVICQSLEHYYACFFPKYTQRAGTLFSEIRRIIYNLIP